MTQAFEEKYSKNTKLQVGSHEAIIEKYLTSGGFAQVYTARINSIGNQHNSQLACLKRVIVPNKPSLNSLRAEVDAMKLLRNNRHIVSYIDSHARRLPTTENSYEVLLIMEFCSRGGLIDLMNARLSNRFKEYEILKIMTDITKGIYCMHQLESALIHRDIKIENVLVSGDGDFKICDFGSVCGVLRPPSSSDEFSYLQHDILKNTTAQYRSPEMVDLTRGYSIDEKSDIWALGVLLYKLCYYTTPFEKEGSKAILHSKFVYPAYPQFSDSLKNIIRVLLSENPMDRPNICQLLSELYRIQNQTCPLPNFYIQRAMIKSQANKTESIAIPYMNNNSTYSLSLTSKSSPSKINLHNQSYGSQHSTISIPHSSPQKSNTLNGISSQRELYSGRRSPVKFLENMRLEPSFNDDSYSPAFKTDTQHNSFKNNRLQQQDYTAGTSEILHNNYDKNIGKNNINSEGDENPHFQDVMHSYKSSKYEDSRISSAGSKNIMNSSLSRTESIISNTSMESLSRTSTGASIIRNLSSKSNMHFTGEERSHSPIKPRQNTGGSIRSAFNKIRQGFNRSSSRVSSSESTIRKVEPVDDRTDITYETGYQFENRSMSRTTSQSDHRISSVSKNSLASLNETSSEKPFVLKTNQEAKSSIKERVQALMKSSEDKSFIHTAHGYGKYTERPNLKYESSHGVSTTFSHHHFKGNISDKLDSKYNPLKPDLPAKPLKSKSNSRNALAVSTKV